MSDSAAFAGGLSEAPAPADGASPSEAAAGQQERRAALLQFPRRALLLLIAFGLALAFLAAVRALLAATLPMPPVDKASGLGDWSMSWAASRPVSEVVQGALPNTLTLLGAGLALASVLALLWTLAAILLQRLEQRTGPLGSILKLLGRLLVLGPAAAPVLGTGVLLLFILSMQLRLLPVAGMARPGAPHDRLPYLILPALALALLPAALTAQALARELTRPPEVARGRRWLVSLLQGLGTLFGQVGGMLSALVVIETIFAWPGIGRWAIQAVMSRDYPMLFGSLSAYAVVVLAARLLAELCRWLERLLRRPISAAHPAPILSPKRARTIWLVLALALLVLPLALAAGGLLVGPGAAIRQDLSSALLPPSSAHPLGTDALGRDVAMRLLRAATVTLGLAALVAGLVLVPGLLCGALAGYLAGRRQLWAESLADLLLLPADVLLLLPALPAAMLMLVLFLPMGSPASASAALGTVVILAVAFVLLPRAVHACQALWLAAPSWRSRWAVGLAGAGALLFGTLFAGLGLVTGLEFLGLGAVPAMPTLGGELAQALRAARQNTAWLPAAALAISACALAFCAAADALMGLFRGKEALARLHE